MKNPDYAKLPQELECSWTMNELIPMLMEAYPGRSWPYWKEGIRQAYLRINSLAIYEDFESTVERFRLLLVNPDILSRAEKEDFGFLRDSHAVCIQVFVRHFVNHGDYRLHSLGKNPDPDHPRRIVTEQYQDTYVYAGKLAMRRSVFTKKHAAPWTRRCGQHKVLEATKVEEEVKELEKEEFKKELEELAVSKAPAENGVAIHTAQEIQHSLPQRPQYAPEGRQNTERGTQIGDYGTARPPPPHRSPAMPPANPAPYPPGGMIAPPTSPAYKQQQSHHPGYHQIPYQNGPAYGYPTMQSGTYTQNYMPSVAHGPHMPYTGPVQPYQNNGNMGPGHYQPTPAYATQYGYGGGQAYQGPRIPQLNGTNDMCSQDQRPVVQARHYSLHENARNGVQVVASQFQPDVDAHHLHGGACEFVPGASGHNF